MYTHIHVYGDIRKHSYICPSPHHPIIPSPHHRMIPSPHHPIIPAPHHLMIPSPHHPITHHTIMPSPHHQIIPSSHHPCKMIIKSYCSKKAHWKFLVQHHFEIYYGRWLHEIIFGKMFWSNFRKYAGKRTIRSVEVFCCPANCKPCSILPSSRAEPKFNSQQLQFWQKHSWLRCFVDTPGNSCFRDPERHKGDPECRAQPEPNQNIVQNA